MGRSGRKPQGGRRTGGGGGKENRCRWEAGTGRRSRHREAESQSGILNVITCFDDLDSASTLCSLASSAAATLALRRFGGLAVLLAVLAGGSNSEKGRTSSATHYAEVRVSEPATRTSRCNEPGSGIHQPAPHRSIITNDRPLFAAISGSPLLPDVELTNVLRCAKTSQTL